MAYIPIRFSPRSKIYKHIGALSACTGQPATQDGIVLHSRPVAEKIIWEYGRRNSLLRA